MSAGFVVVILVSAALLSAAVRAGAYKMPEPLDRLNRSVAAAIAALGSISPSNDADWHFPLERGKVLSSVLNALADKLDAAVAQASAAQPA